jgi:small subunit ribosomal protein S16e
MSNNRVELVQCFGRKRNAVAVASVRHGKGLLKINGCPVDTLEPAVNKLFRNNHNYFNLDLL